MNALRHGTGGEYIREQNPNYQSQLYALKFDGVKPELAERVINRR